MCIRASSSSSEVSSSYCKFIVSHFSLPCPHFTGWIIIVATIRIFICDLWFQVRRSESNYDSNKCILKSYFEKHDNCVESKFQDFISDKLPSYLFKLQPDNLHSFLRLSVPSRLLLVKVLIDICIQKSEFIRHLSYPIAIARSY